MENAVWAFILFHIFGWAYYMVATILMKGTIFASMRLTIARKAETSAFHRFVKEMLGCLMCTATEAAMWTLGVAAAILGSVYRIPSHVIGTLSGGEVAIPMAFEIMLSFASALALSFAVAGEAWAIKLIVENRDEKFLALREEFRAREAELLDRLAKHETGQDSATEYEFDLR